jgi:hypothetical protein
VLTRKRVEAAVRAGQTIDWDRLERHANEMMWHLLRVMTTVPLDGREPLPPPWPGHGDPNDVPVWATAKLAGTKVVVSHDLRHYPPRVGGRHVYEGIEYLTAIEFIEGVLGASAHEALGGPLPPGAAIRSGRSAVG